MKLILDNILTHIVESQAPEVFWLREFLSQVDTRNMFYVDRQGVARRRDDGANRLHLLNTVTKTFPSGMTRQVLNVGRELGHEILVADGRKRPCNPELQSDLEWLFDFQGAGTYKNGDDTVDGVIRTCWQRTRGLIKSPTGSGKTEMMAGLVKSIPCKWLLLVDDKDLVHNAARRFEKRLDESIGRAGDGIWDVHHRIVCATFQTIARKLRDPDTMLKTRKWLELFGGLLVDECHSTSADSFYQVVTTIPAYWRFGFSGTPLDRADRMGIFTIAALGDVIAEVPTQLLIERKIIAKPIIEMHYCEQHEKKAKTFQGVYSELVGKSTLRNKLIADLTNGTDKPALVFVKHMAHGKDLVKRLKKRGMSVEFVHGKTSTSQRDAIVDKLEWGDLEVVVVSKVWQKGKDIPCLGSVINAAGHRSLIPVIQQMGRGTRVVRDKAGNIIKDSFKMIDIYDRGNKWLQRHATERLRAYRNEGHAVEVVGAP